MIQRLCEGAEGEGERAKRKDEKYLALSLQAFVERRGREGGSEALPVEDKETGRGLKQSFESGKNVRAIVKGKSVWKNNNEGKLQRQAELLG